MKKITVVTVYRIIRVIFVITACIGLFFLVGYIGNVDYCTEQGIECEIELPHLIISAAVFVTGIICYKIAAKLVKMI